MSTTALDALQHPRPERLALITDFGPGPYVGQLHLLASAQAPALPLINLVADLPAFRPDLAAYWLPALIRGMPDGTIYLCVVDPGVGGARAALALRIGLNWFVGPDNGLFVPLLRRCEAAASDNDAADYALWRIDWRPERLSASFHGRDVFLPIALTLTQGRLPLPCQRCTLDQMQGTDWPLSSACILYVDHYGNLITGLEADEADPDHSLCIETPVGNPLIQAARTFCEVPEGAAFWYRNAFDLVEIAANQRRADQLFGVSAGDGVAWAARPY